MQIDYHKLPKRYVMCVDVKSFFASVEAVRRGMDPLRAYIVVVAHLDIPGSVVLASSPLIKKEFGIKTGNRNFEIPHHPKIIKVEPSMALYLEQNRQIYQIMCRYAAQEDILPYSIDESFIDVTETVHLFGDPWQMGKQIARDIFQQLGLVVSIGIGDNPLLSKLALDNEAKKTIDQMAYWSYDNIPDTLWKIEHLTDVWGISKGYAKRFLGIGIATVYQLAHYDPNVLKERFGIMGLQHYYHANGVDYSMLRERKSSIDKSYSRGQVLPKDYDDPLQIKIILFEMVEDVTARLRAHNMLCQGIGLSIRYHYDSEQVGFSKHRKLSRATDQTKRLCACFWRLFCQYWDPTQSVRKLDVVCDRLIQQEYQQLDLFAWSDDVKQARVDTAFDRVRLRYGKTALFYGYSLVDGSTFFERARYVGGHKAASEVENVKDTVGKAQRISPSRYALSRSRDA